MKCGFNMETCFSLRVAYQIILDTNYSNQNCVELTILHLY